LSEVSCFENLDDNYKSHVGHYEKFWKISAYQWRSFHKREIINLNANSHSWAKSVLKKRKKKKKKKAKHRMNTMVAVALSWNLVKRVVIFKSQTFWKESYQTMNTILYCLKAIIPITDSCV
jgi:hypothetical protein